MNKIIPLLLFVIILSCNKYETPHPNVRLNIHVLDEETGAIYAENKGVIRTSNYYNSSFTEETESILFDSAYSDQNGDFSFDIPFVNGIPQNHYEIELFREEEASVTTGRSLDKYIQHDTLIISGITQLDIKVQNASCRMVSLSALGYRKEEDYKRDSAKHFVNPGQIARFFVMNVKDTLISKTLLFSYNKIVVLQIIDREVDPPQLIKYDVLEMEKDSIKLHCVQI